MYFTFCNNIFQLKKKTTNKQHKSIGNNNINHYLILLLNKLMVKCKITYFQNETCICVRKSLKTLEYVIHPGIHKLLVSHLKI